MTRRRQITDPVSLTPREVRARCSYLLHITRRMTRCNNLASEVWEDFGHQDPVDLYLCARHVKIMERFFPDVRIGTFEDTT